MSAGDVHLCAAHVRLPAGQVCEDNVALLCAPLDEGDTRVPLPVTHGLLEDGPLAACSTERQTIRLHFP